MDGNMMYLADLPQQVMNAMAFTPENIPNFIAMVLCMTFGYLLYVWALRILVREHVDPYPLWLHCWMITIDISGTIMSWQCALEYDFFWVFVLFGIGLPIWVFMEGLCIFMGIKNHRQEEFGDIVKGDVKESTAWFFALGMIVVSFGINEWIIFSLGGFANWSIFLIWPFTNYVFAYWTWRFWMREGVKHGTRYRNSMGLQVIITIQITLMWVPGLSWYVAVTPFLDIPAYYFCGITASILAAYNLYKCSKLKPVSREDVPKGKKPIW